MCLLQEICTNQFNINNSPHTWVHSLLPEPCLTGARKHKLECHNLFQICISCLPWHAHLDYVSPVPKLWEDSTPLWSTTQPFFLSKCILKFSDERAVQTLTCSYICPKMSTTALTPKHLQKMLYISYILNYITINIYVISYRIYNFIYKNLNKSLA